MPNIVEYNAAAGPGAAPQPTDRAADTAREAGAVQERMARVSGESIALGYRTLGGAISHGGGAIGAEIDRHLTAQAISKGGVVYSSLFNNLTDSWNKLASQTDPNDISISAGFKEHTLEPAIQQFQQAFENEPEAVQRWAIQRADDMRQHFFVKTSADMGIRAADAAQHNIQNSVNNYSVLAGNDPSAMAHAIESFRTDLKAQLDSNPYLDAAQAARIHDELTPRAEYAIAKSAGDAMGKANPDAYINAINNGEFDKYFTGDQKIEAIHYAEGVKRAQEADQNRQYELQKRQTADAQEKTMNGYLTNILAGQGKDVVKSISTDESLTPMQRENLINFQREHIRQMREQKDNTPHPEEFRDQLNYMFAQFRANPNNMNVQRIRQAFTDGKLNPTEEAQLEARFKAMDNPFEQNYHTQMMHVDSAIKGNVQFVGQPELAADALNRIDTDAHNVVDQYRKEGKDVTPLLDPTSKDYLFSPARIKTYLIPIRQTMADQANAVRQASGGGTPAPAVPAGAVVHNGYHFPNQAALDAYLKAGGK